MFGSKRNCVRPSTTTTALQENDPETTQFWVDFANKTLGGGVVGNGFVQEETMFLETPELANAPYRHRPPSAGRAATACCEGSPTPWIFRGANRVMNMDSGLGDIVDPANKIQRWMKISVQELNHADHPLHQAELINVLSMAAPLLPKYGPKAELTTVKDLFNTFVAGFSLAESAGHGQPIRVHTGPIGAGVFNNDPVVVYVLHASPPCRSAT